MQRTGNAGRPARVPQGAGTQEVWVGPGSPVPALVGPVPGSEHLGRSGETPDQKSTASRRPVAPYGCLMAWAMALGQPATPAVVGLWAMALGLVAWGVVAPRERHLSVTALAPGWVGAAWWASAEGTESGVRAAGACAAVMVTACCVRIVQRRPDPVARVWGVGAGGLGVVVLVGTALRDLPFTGVVVAAGGVTLTRCAPALAWWPPEGWLTRLPHSVARPRAPLPADMGDPRWCGWTASLLRRPVREATVAAVLAAVLGCWLGALGMVLGAASVRADGVVFEQAVWVALLVAWWWSWVRRSGLVGGVAAGWLFGVAAGVPLAALSGVGAEACGAVGVAAIAWAGGLALAWTAARGTRAWDLLWWPGSALSSAAVALWVVGVVAASGLVARVAGFR